MIFYDATITIPNVGSYYIGTGKMINIEISTFDRSDLQLPSWGILSNSASIEFKDTDLTFLHLAESNQLNEGAECEIRVNNTDRQSLNKIGVFKAKEWTYDNNTHTVFVSLRDNLEEWQDINGDCWSSDTNVGNNEIGTDELSSQLCHNASRTPTKDTNTGRVYCNQSGGY